MRSTASTDLPSPGRTSPRRRSVVPTAAVGRIGSLAIEYVRQGERTVFGRTNCRTPWHLLPPIYLDESGSAYTLLVNPSGGLVGGDHLSIHLSVGPKAHVLISTPSANRVYRSLSQEAIHTVTIAVADGGILEWMPEHTIPFAGSRFRQSIDVTLGHGAVVVLWDAVASGRIAQGERWRFTSVNNHIHIQMPSQGSLCEQYALSPAEIDGGLGAAQEWDYVGSLFIVGDGVSATHWSSLEAALAAIVGEYRDQSVLGGVSQPAVSGVVVKLVAKSAPVMTHILMDMWAAVRRLLWQMPRADLRKY